MPAPETTRFSSTVTIVGCLRISRPTQTFGRFCGASAPIPVNARWQEYMKDLMEFQVDPKTNFPIRLEETFHLD